MDEHKINEILAPMTTDQRKDYYYLASLAMNDNDPEHSPNSKQIAAVFGDCSLLTLHLVMSACYSALTPGEQNDDYHRAEQKLNAIANAGPQAAATIHERNVAELIPLLAIRTRVGMTQKELSQKSGVNVRQLRRIETGEAKIDNITAANLVAIADALNVDVHDLMPKRQNALDPKDSTK